MYKRQCSLLLISFLLSFSLIFSQERQDSRLLKTLSKLPNWDASTASIQKIEGGLTNINYKVRVDFTDYFVRCSSSQNHFLGITLEKEWRCHSLAAQAGLSPSLIFYSPEDRILITAFIETQGRKVDLRDRDTQSRFCRLVRAMHGNGQLAFANVFCPFTCIHHYFRDARALGVSLPTHLFDSILPAIATLRDKIYLTPVKTVPCHLDLHRGNVLDDGARLWLIDWEYAAIGDPLFDLAVVTSTENFSEEEMQTILKTYFDGRTPTQKEMQYFYFMRVLSDVRWALWCYIQCKISTISYSFASDGDRYLDHALKYLDILKHVHD